MVCYSNGYKACCTKVVLFVSTLLFLFGLLTCVFGGMSMGAIPGGDKLAGKIPDMSSFGLGIIIVGLVIILTGILGCCTGKTKKCLPALLFIIFSGLLGLICLILGFIMVGGSGLVMKATDLACQGAADAF